MGPHTDKRLDFPCGNCNRRLGGVRIPISEVAEFTRLVNEQIAIADDRDRLLDDARD